MQRRRLLASMIFLHSAQQSVRRHLMQHGAQRLDASGERMTFAGTAPRLYVCLRCTNTINALATWTGADGQKGACKDFADLPRYFAQSGPEYFPETNGRPRGGGTF
jgi:hypothetical protein